MLYLRSRAGLILALLVFLVLAFPLGAQETVVDDFSDMNSGWQSFEGDCSSYYRNGRLRTEIIQDTVSRCWNYFHFEEPEWSVTDFEVEVVVEHVKGDGAAGLIFRAANGGFYTMVVNPQSGEWAMYVNDPRNPNWLDLMAGPNPVIRRVGTNTLTVAIEGARMTLSINGQQVSTISDETFAEGWFGVLVLRDGSEEDVVFDFDDFRLTSSGVAAPPTSEPTLPPPTATDTPPSPIPTTAPTTDSDRQFLFMSNRDGDGEIYLWNLENDDIQQLTDNSIYDFDPAWSPDGSLIAFGSDVGDEGESDIIVMAADGRSPRNLTNTPTIRERSPIFSPDGQRIFFTFYAASNVNGQITQQIGVVNLDGSGYQTFIDDGYGHDLFDIAADGTIYFNTQYDWFGETIREDAETGIESIRVDGSNRQEIVHVAGLVGNGTLMPEQNGLVVSWYDPVTENSDLHRLLFGQSSLTPITETGYIRESNPSYSPDGEYMAFIQWDSESIATLVLMDGDGNRTSITGRNWHQTRSVTWRPDGSQTVATTTQQSSAAANPLDSLAGQILFHTEQDGDSEIHRLDLPSMNVVQLTDNDTSDDDANWSLDGQHIIFSRKINDQFDLFMMDANGSNVRQITNSGWSERNGYLSSDGTRIVYTYYSSDGCSSIGIANVDGTDNSVFLRDDGQYKLIGWSPDDVVYILNMHNWFKEGAEAETAIERINGDRTGRQEILRVPGILYRAYLAPQGNQLIGMMLKDDDDMDLVRIDLNTNEIRMITRTSDFTEMDPTIDPISGQVVYVGYENATGWRLYLYGENDTRIPMLPASWNRVLFPRWRPDGSIITPVSAPAATATQASATGCYAASISSNINLRVEPGTNAGVLGTISPGEQLEVLGEAADWVAVRMDNGRRAWAASWVVRLEGRCNNLPQIDVQVPATATPVPTATPTASSQTSNDQAAAPDTTLPDMPEDERISFTINGDGDTIFIDSGECVTVTWDVAGIQEVYYQDEGVAGQGSRQECLVTSADYQLRVIHADGSTSIHWVYVNVREPEGLGPFRFWVNDREFSYFVYDSQSWNTPDIHLCATSPLSFRWDVPGVESVTYYNFTSSGGPINNTTVPISGSAYELPPPDVADHNYIIYGFNPYTFNGGRPWHFDFNVYWHLDQPCQ